jgi:hypothetical protein
MDPIASRLGGCAVPRERWCALDSRGDARRAELEAEILAELPKGDRTVARIVFAVMDALALHRGAVRQRKRRRVGARVRGRRKHRARRVHV